MGKRSEFFQAYGLTIASDVGLPELRPAAKVAVPDLTIAEVPSGITPPKDPAFDHANLKVSADQIWLHIPQIADLLIAGGSRVSYSRAEGSDDASLRAFLLGSGLGGTLIKRGHTVLHGNAIEVGNHCLMCVGVSGAGKSTTALGLLKRGYRVVADDVCPLDADGHVLPGMPHIKLWEDAAQALCVETGGMPRVTPAYPKVRMPLGDQFVSQALPIGSLFELAPRDAPGIEVEPLKGAAKLALLHRNLYRLEYVRFGGHLPTVFAQLAAQFADVPAFRIHRPTQGFELDALLDALVNTHQAVLGNQSGQ